MPKDVYEIIDETDVVIGKSTREEIHAKGLRHRGAAILLESENGAFLIPTGSKVKHDAGKLYHSAAGHVHVGESYLQAAARELQEEAGITLPQTAFAHAGGYWSRDEDSIIEHLRFEVFIACYLPAMGEIVLNKEQERGLWLDRGELRSLYEENPERLSTPLRLTCERVLGFTLG